MLCGCVYGCSVQWGMNVLYEYALMCHRGWRSERCVSAWMHDCAIVGGGELYTIEVNPCDLSGDL